jgi:hypothetical protein
VRPPAQVTLSVDSEPPGAEVYRAFDGIRVGQTPMRLTLAPSPGEAVFVLRMPGRKDRKVALPADRDGTLRVRLEPAKAKQSVPVKPPGPRRIGDGTID